MKNFLVGLIAAALVLLFAATVYGTDEHQLTVDGNTYAPTKISGDTVHYETPDVNPAVAFTERHQWVGNGSEWLPCEGGIHWIDNKNLLTVSHCLDGPTTTTTTSPTTTLPTSTTTSGASTTTTEPTTTTTAPTTTTSSSTTTAEPTTTSTSSTVTTTTATSSTSTSTVQPTTPTTTTPTELPKTGPIGLAWFALFGGLFTILGAATIYATRKDNT